MKNNEKINITTIPMGENKTLFVPLDSDGVCSALGFFVKNEGKFTETIFASDVIDHIDEITPVVAFKFKNKKSITDVIKFLRFYRDNIYKKEYKEVEDEKN